MIITRSPLNDSKNVSSLVAHLETLSWMEILCGIRWNFPFFFRTLIDGVLFQPKPFSLSDRHFPSSLFTP